MFAADRALLLLLILADAFWFEARDVQPSQIDPITNGRSLVGVEIEAFLHCPVLVSDVWFTPATGLPGRTDASSSFRLGNADPEQVAGSPPATLGNCRACDQLRHAWLKTNSNAILLLVTALTSWASTPRAIPMTMCLIC